VRNPHHAGPAYVTQAIKVARVISCIDSECGWSSDIKELLQLYQ